MNNRLKRFTTWSILMMSHFFVLAQYTDSLYVDVDAMLKQNGWLTSRNTVGLQNLPVKYIATADMFFEKNEGGFRNYYQSNNSRSFGAKTESWKRLNDKVILKGGLRYNNFSGNNMTGSVWIDPYKYMLGLVEYSDANAGNKQLEQYLIDGALSVNLSSKFSIGGSVNVEAANYAKRKDLRHSNFLTHIDASLGLGQRIGNSAMLGGSYHYIRRIESIRFETFGNKDVQYMGMADFGLFMGQASNFRGNGSVDDGYISYTKRPIVNQTHEAAIQLGIELSPASQLFTEVSYGRSNGYFGKKGNTQITYTQNNAHRYQYTLAFNTKKENNHYLVQFKGGYETASNQENVFREVVDEGNRRTIAYYGQNDIADKNLTHTQLLIAAFLNEGNNIYKWKLELGGAYNRRDQIVNLYPFFRRQDLQSNNVYFTVVHNHQLPQSLITYSLNVEYGAGSGTALKEGFYMEPESDQPVPQTMNTYLYQEFEYFTKPRFAITPSIQYTFMNVKTLYPYLKILDSYTSASKVQYLKKSFNSFSVALGCFF